MPMLSVGRRTLALGLIVLGFLLNPWLVGYLLTSDHRIDDMRYMLVGLFLSAGLVLAGLQIAIGWVRWIAFGREVHLRRVSAVILILSAAITGTYWRVSSFRTQHRHAHVVGNGHDQPTAAEQQWADDFYARSLAAALRNGWFDYDKAMTQGFQPDRINATHYPNLQNMFDGVILDPEKPEWLIFDTTPSGKVLMGFMFFTSHLEDTGPTPGGPLALWHYHTYPVPRCAVQGLWTVAKTDQHGRCAEGIPVSRTPEMFHVWFIDHPLGRFTEMKVVPEVAEEAQFEPGTLHPIVVHFAIGLFVVAVLIDLFGLVVRKDYGHASWININLAVIAVIAAVAIGMSAEVASKPTHEGHQILDVHKLFAFSSLAAVLLLWFWRYALRGRFPAGAAAVVYVVVSLAGLAAVTGAGYYGGQLVYEQGVGVRAVDAFARARYWQQVRDVYRRGEVVPVSTRPAQESQPVPHHHH